MKTTTRERAIRLTDAQVRAALDGRLSEVREPVKPTLPEWDWIGWDNSDPPQLWSWRGDMDESAEPWERLACPWQPGDVLWCQEAWAVHFMYDNLSPDDTRAHHERCADKQNNVWYRADGDDAAGSCGCPAAGRRGNWRPSTQMPRELSRIEFEVTAVRAEKLSEITEAGAIAEGFRAESTPGCGVNDWWCHATCKRHGECMYRLGTAADVFCEHWNRRYSKHPFDSDCWVWVRELRRIKP